MKEPKPIKVDREEKWKIEKILNKQKIREITKYLVYWKKFIAKYNI